MLNKDLAQTFQHFVIGPLFTSPAPFCISLVESLPRHDALEDIVIAYPFFRIVRSP